MYTLEGEATLALFCFPCQLDLLLRENDLLISMKFFSFEVAGEGPVRRPREVKVQETRLEATEVVSLV